MGRFLGWSATLRVEKASCLFRRAALAAVVIAMPVASKGARGMQEGCKRDAKGVMVGGRRRSQSHKDK